MTEIPVVLGDVDMNGSVNFLDIAPFIDLLAFGEFKAEADTNLDQMVTFLDIAGFVQILTDQ